MEDAKKSDAVVEDLRRRIKELESKLGEHEKEKVLPKLSEEAAETLLSEEGAPKWIANLGAALVRLFKEPEGLEGLIPIQLTTNEVRATMLDTKESYTNKYYQKSKDRQEHVGRNSQSQGSRPRKKHNPSLEQMLDRGGKKDREKIKAGYLWFIEYEGDKFYMTKAGDAYNVKNDVPEKCRQCGQRHRVCIRDLV